MESWIQTLPYYIVISCEVPKIVIFRSRGGLSEGPLHKLWWTERVEGLVNAIATLSIKNCYKSTMNKFKKDNTKINKPFDTKL